MDNISWGVIDLLLAGLNFGMWYYLRKDTPTTIINLIVGIFMAGLAMWQFAGGF